MNSVFAEFSIALTGLVWIGFMLIALLEAFAALFFKGTIFSFGLRLFEEQLPGQAAAPRPATLDTKNGRFRLLDHGTYRFRRSFALANDYNLVSPSFVCGTISCQDDVISVDGRTSLAFVLSLATLALWSTSAILLLTEGGRGAERAVYAVAPFALVAALAILLVRYERRAGQRMIREWQAARDEDSPNRR